MEASAEPQEASAKRWKAVARPVSAGVDGPDGGVEAHGYHWVGHPVLHDARPGNGIPLSRYRQSLGMRSKAA